MNNYKSQRGSPPHDAAVRRAALPEVLFSEDIALILNLNPEEAEVGALSGQFGPHLLVGGQPALLKDDFLTHLAARAAGSVAREKEVLP